MTTHSLLTLTSSTPILVSPPGTHSGADITIQNVNAAGYIYLGGEGVASSSYGFRLSPNQGFSLELSGNDSLYVVASDDDLKVAILTASLEEGS